MSWHDVMKINESAEDSALRAELQDILCMAPVQHPTIEATPDTITLAELLHREAMRRRRTGTVVKPMSRRPLFILVAAAVPVLFTVTALGTWGVKQKRQADNLAAKVQELESRQNRVDTAREGARNREDQPLLTASEIKPDVSPDAKPNRTPNNNGELVKPEESPRRLNSRPDQYRVNDLNDRR